MRMASRTSPKITIMQKISTIAALLLCSLAGAASAGDDSGALGQREFLKSCATCHGSDGKARTPAAGAAKPAPADLTQLSKKNGGYFPTARVYETIDGRLAVAAHGPRDMPLWGQVYTSQAGPAANNPYPAEAAVRSRIHALIDYIYLLQEKD